MPRITAKKVAVSAFAAVTMLVSGVAMASWLSTATGSGRSGAVTAVQLTVNAASGTADLYPGATQGNAYFTITNPNPYAVTFTSMALGSAIVNTVPGDATACPPTNVTATGATGLTLTVAASTTSPMQSINGIVSMASAAPDGCQGKTFDIPMTLSGHSA
jgi:hypothetical protein